MGACLEQASGLRHDSALVGGQVAGEGGAREVGLQQRIGLGVGVCPLGRLHRQRRMQQQLPHRILVACTVTDTHGDKDMSGALLDNCGQLQTMMRYVVFTDQARAQ